MAARFDNLRLVVGVPVKLPFPESAEIAEPKVVDYLLNPQHPSGGSKARFFLAHGFRTGQWHAFADAIRAMVAKTSVTLVVDSMHGRKYIIDGPVETPNGYEIRVRTVWIADLAQPTPRLVTAYPQA